MFSLLKTLLSSIIFILFCLVASQGYAQTSEEESLYGYAEISDEESLSELSDQESLPELSEEEKCNEIMVADMMSSSELPAEASTYKTYYDFDKADLEREKRKCRRMEKEERKQQKNDEEEYMKSLWREYGPDFIEESLKTLHGDLELALFTSDYYLACLENDDTWFYENSEKLDFFTSKERCEEELNRVREKIKEKYPLMIRYLTIYNYRGIGMQNRCSENLFANGATDNRTPSIICDESKGLHDEFQNVSEDDNLDEIMNKNLKRHQAMVHFQQNKGLIRHLIPGLVDLPPISVEDLISAEQLVDKNEFFKKTLLETGLIPEGFVDDGSTEEVADEFIAKNEVVCANPNRDEVSERIGPDISCYKDKYRELILGNREKMIEGLPILGFVTSANPTDEELIQAIGKIRGNSAKLLDDFREDYFTLNSENEYDLSESVIEDLDSDDFMEKLDLDTSFFDAFLSIFGLKDTYVDIFSIFSGRLYSGRNGFEELYHLKNTPSEYGNSPNQFEEMINFGYEAYEKKIGRRLWVEMGVIVGWVIGCYVVFKGNPLANGICQLPMGLGVNAYFYVVDTKRYKEVLSMALYRPDDARPSYQESKKLDELALAKRLSTILLPFFTGIQQITKAAGTGTGKIGINFWKSRKKTSDSIQSSAGQKGASNHQESIEHSNLSGSLEE